MQSKQCRTYRVANARAVALRTELFAYLLVVRTPPKAAGTLGRGVGSFRSYSF